MPHNRPVMIVEDSEVDYETARRALKRFDSTIETLWCQSAEDAIDALSGAEAAAEPLPALIFMDINMPGAGGIAFLKKVKSGESSLKFLPVVMLSSSERQSDIDSCYSAGANGYLVKSADLDHFYSRIATLCSYWFDTVKLPTALTDPANDPLGNQLAE